VSRNPARFDETKLRWLNGVYLRGLSVPSLSDSLREFAAHSAAGMLQAAQDEPERFAGAVAISQEKIHTLADFWPLSGFLFEEPVEDSAARERWLSAPARVVLDAIRRALESLPDFDEQTIRQALGDVVEELDVKPREVYQPLRVALTGTTVSPGMFESVALLGREKTLARIDAAVARIQ
jgi:glutamyl-tRNA synthetase